jgi:AraC-like DNA-binding protein
MLGLDLHFCATNPVGLYCIVRVSYSIVRQMLLDPLSDVLSLLRVRNVAAARVEGFGPWALSFEAYRHIKFGGLVEGECWVWIPGFTDAVKLNAGDFYLLTNGTPYCFASDLDKPLLDGRTVFAESPVTDGIIRHGSGQPRSIAFGGLFTFDDETSGLLLNLLPPLIHIQGNSPHARPLRAALDLICFETEAVRPGAGAMVGSLANIILMNILRAYLASDTRPVGWLGALADTKIGKALGLMHGDIARRWKVEDLAVEVGMSRTSFAERFKALVGAAPLEYLIRWRLVVGRNALRSEKETLATIAQRIGYESETAFGLAFKKMFGVSPGRYRVSVAKSRNELVFASV